MLEIDDESHDWRDETERIEYIEAEGFPILRLTNKYVAEDLGAVQRTVSLWVAELKAGRRPE